MRFRKQLLLFLVLSLPLAHARAQEWVVPADQKGTVASFKFTPEMQKQGENLYMKNCSSCHGMPGKNNFAKLTPPPGDLSLARVQKQVDGELFYRITNGKTPMPEFRNIITEDERWWIISFLRSFNPKYVQPNPAAKAGFNGKMVKLHMIFDTVQHRVRITAIETTKDKGEVPAQGIGIALSVKRYFGNMLLGDPKATSEHGIASFEFPADLPGDIQGKVELTCRVNDPAGTISSSPVTATFSIGVPTDKPGLTETRAWWSTREKAPVWLILAYSLSVITVWIIIISIFISMLSIKKLIDN